MQIIEKLAQGWHHRCGDNFIVAGTRLAKGDIGADGPMQKAAFLLHHADMGAQAVLGYLCNILSINQYRALFQIVKPQQQFDQRQLLLVDPKQLRRWRRQLQHIWPIGPVIH